MAEQTETQVKIIDVRDDARWKHSVDADIPAFGDRTFKYIAWRKEQGDPPAVGETLLATMEPWKRSNYYIKQGAFEDGGEEMDGTEKPWQLDWYMVAARPLGASEINGAGETPTPTRTDAVRATSDAAPTVFLDGNLRFQVGQESTNDREAIRMVLAHGEAEGGNIYANMDDVLKAAGQVAGWLNRRLVVRLSGGMVGRAETLGAVVVEEEIAPEVTRPSTTLKNRAELQEWVEERGWSKEQVVAVLQKSGYEDSREYLAKRGNSLDSLAQLLDTELL